MRIIFVTGGLASGKSTVCELLAKTVQPAGTAIVIDADDIAKELLELDFIISDLVEAYGPTILSRAGQINHAKLAEVAFFDSESVHELNATLWPLVHEQISDLILSHSPSLNEGDLLIFEISMLAESSELYDTATLADLIITVSCNDDVKLDRAVTRGMDKSDAQNRLSLQVSDKTRAEMADWTIDNNGTPEQVAAQLVDCFTQLALLE